MENISDQHFSNISQIIYLLVPGQVCVAEADVGQLQHVLLDDLRDVLHPLGWSLRSVGQRLSAPVNLGQSSLERRRGPWSLAVMSGRGRGEFGSLRSGVG